MEKLEAVQSAQQKDVARQRTVYKAETNDLMNDLLADKHE